MKKTILFLAALTGFLTQCRAAERRVIMRNSFDSAAEQRLFSSAPVAAWEGAAAGQWLRIAATERHAANTVQAALDLAPYAGREIILKCRVKAQDVSRPQERHNGIKVMLHYQTPSGGKQWPGISLPDGTFEWRDFSRTLRLPEDIGEAVIVLGLQDSTGTVLFDDLTLALSRHQIVNHPPPMLNPPPVFKGHHLPRLRGAMTGSGEITEEDVRNFAEEWGGNLFRFQINRNWHMADDNRDIAEYNRWIDSRLAVLERVLGYCEKYGILVAVDLHALPGGRYENRSMAMFYEKPYADEFVRVWEKIARRLRGRRFIWGYDLVNEPVHDMELPEGMEDFRELQIRAARAIRAIDPDTPIIFEVFKWDSPEGFRYMTPVDMPKILYQAHMYMPGSYTHQGLHDSPAGIVYPGEINGRRENRETLRAYLQPVRDFQLAYNVHIYIGEFSAIRWAPGAERYLDDVISIFEEYDWDWSYHAYREAQCWSLEHTEDKNKTELQTS
jgi:endoglucanase